MTLPATVVVNLGGITPVISVIKPAVSPVPFVPRRASQLASPQVSSSPSRHEDRERRRRRRRNSGDRDRDSSGRRDGRSKGGRDDRRALPTDYRGALAKFAPPAPHALLKKIGSKDVQGLGKVSVPWRRQGGPRPAGRSSAC